MLHSIARHSKNAFEILSQLPEHGIGTKLTRITWPPNSFWSVTRVKMSPDGAHGKAYGHLTWKGQQREEREQEIRGPLKKLWTLVGNISPIAVESPAAAKLRQELAVKAPQKSHDDADKPAAVVEERGEEADVSPPKKEDQS